MPLLNYTTSIDTGKTVNEITMMLSRARASAILSEFDDQQHLTAVSFKIQTKFGIMAFRLPCEPKAVMAVINNQVLAGKIPRRYRDDMEQARRVGWRIIKDWLEAQLAIVETQMVSLDQVFLPYAQNESGQTLYEVMSGGGFSGLALPAPQ